MNYSRAKSILIGVVGSAVLMTLPSFMILRTVKLVNMPEAGLWILQAIFCVAAAIYFSKSKQTIVSAILIYGFLLLYNALAILCTALNYWVIAWVPFNSLGLGLIGIAIGVCFTLPQKMGVHNAQKTRLACIATALTGMSFVYGTLVPLLVIPGAIILLTLSGKEVYTLE